MGGIWHIIVHLDNMVRSVPGFPSIYSFYRCLTTGRWRRWVAWHSSPLTIWGGRSLDFPPCILFTDAWLQGDDADGWHDIVHLWQYGDVGPWISLHVHPLWIPDPRRRPLDFPPYILLTDTWLEGDDADGWFVIVHLWQYGEVDPWISLQIFDAWLEGDDADGWHDIVHLDNMMEMMKES